MAEKRMSVYSHKRKQSWCCFNCGDLGHQKRKCPRIQCYRCKSYGHISEDCRIANVKTNQIAQTQSTHTPATSKAILNGHGIRMSQGNVTQSQSQRPFTADWCGPLSRKRSLSSCEDQSSGIVTQLLLPILEKDRLSDIRANEAVKRVEETIFKMLKNRKGVMCILANKQYQHFQEEKCTGPLFIPKTEEDLQRGDFDVIIIHSLHGYVHLEVKAFGDSQDHMDVRQQVRSLQKTLERALKSLQKGTRALHCLQPPNEKVCILNTLAFPNLSRETLRRALNDKNGQKLREALAKSISPTAEDPGKVDVESLCLCSDDLPSKDETVDEDDEMIRKAITQWWSNITKLSAQKGMNPESFNLLCNSFLEAEEVKSFPDSVYHSGKNCETLLLDEQQLKLIKSDQKNVFVTGVPGCGKTVVLAEKAVQWLHRGETVILIFKQGESSSQPATEILHHFIESIPNSKKMTNGFRCLHKLGLTINTCIEDVIEHMIAIKKNPITGRLPAKLKRRPHNEDFDETMGGVSLETLRSFFTLLALQDLNSQEGLKKAEQGTGINIIIDELTKRTNDGKRDQLITEVQQKLPEARIWCAGPLPCHCPEGFDREILVYPYRCPPTVQRILKATEPECLREWMFGYATSSTKVPNDPMSSSQEKQYTLPEEGPDPVFFTHKGPGEIIDSPQSGDTLLQFFIEKLNMTKDGAQLTDKGITESDVLIVVEGLHTYNNMSRMQSTELYMQLTKEPSQFRVNVSHGSTVDTYDPKKPGMTLMHVRAVAGLEKKVVVFIPCRQYQGKTYAEVVKRPPPVTLTRAQSQELSCLSDLDTHWLWYTASRCQSQLIIFHFGSSL